MYDYVRTLATVNILVATVIFTATRGLEVCKLFLFLFLFLFLLFLLFWRHFTATFVNSN